MREHDKDPSLQWSRAPVNNDAITSDDRCCIFNTCTVANVQRDIVQNEANHQASTSENGAVLKTKHLRTDSINRTVGFKLKTSTIRKG